MALVLVLRPEPGASATASRARELGLNAIAVPLFTVEPIQWDAPEPSAFDGLLLTSANAVRHGGVQLDPLRSLKVYAVGPATAEAALGAGLDVAVAGEGGVDRLLAAIPPNAQVVTCELTGRAMSSEQFAQWLQAQRERALDVGIMIGGAFGLGDVVRRRATSSLSLAPWTMPHELARLVLAEQLYRAGTIVRGEPYHK